MGQKRLDHPQTRTVIPGPVFTLLLFHEAKLHERVDQVGAEHRRVERGVSRVGRVRIGPFV